jgi:hypothetical protein
MNALRAFILRSFAGRNSTPPRVVGTCGIIAQTPPMPTGETPALCYERLAAAYANRLYHIEDAK